MKIRSLLPAVCTVLPFLLVACGSTPQTSPQSTSQAGAATTIDYGPYCGSDCQGALKLNAAPDSINCSVGFAVASTGFPYGVALKNKTEAAAKKLFPNMQFSAADGQGDPAVQSTAVDDLVSRGVKVLIINAAEKNALAPAVKRAIQGGVKVISVDRTVAAPVLTMIKADDTDLGLNAGKYIVTRLGGKGNIVELQGSPAASPTIDRHQGFTDAIKDAPGIKVIASQSANYDRAQGLKVMEDILQRFPTGQINAVFAHNDEMALGAVQAIKAAGRQKDIFVVGVDGQDSAFDSIASGDLAATVVYPVVSPMGIIAAAKACANEQVPQTIKLESPVVTKDNVAKYKGTNF